MGKTWDQLTDEEQKERLAKKLEGKELKGKSMIDAPMLGGVWTPQCCDCELYYIPEKVFDPITCLRFNSRVPRDYLDNSKACPYLVLKNEQRVEAVKRGVTQAVEAALAATHDKPEVSQE